MPRLLIGVTGGIAAYKSCEIIRRLRDRGYEVRVVMTRAATAFVTPLTLQALSGHPVRVDLLDATAESGMDHIALARWAQMVLIAPATADFLARLTHGLADDLLTTLCLATQAPLILAPAMNQQMWQNAATQANVACLRTRGVRILGPASGLQACGESGPGRMLEPADIVQAIVHAIGMPVNGPLSGRRVLLTAGPTHEPLDPVRYLGNRSSGRMGMALAQAAQRAGAQVCVIHGPVAADILPPSGTASFPPLPPIRRIAVETASEMFVAVHHELDNPDAPTDLFIGAAAVADYRPRAIAAQKHKKTTGPLLVELIPTEDILASVAQRQPRPFVVGFAAETRELRTHATDKLQRKGLDMIAANDVSQGQGFGDQDNALTLFWPGGEHSLPRQGKETLASALLEQIVHRMAARATGQMPALPQDF
jgi:phosphopantothenoylcysteine decarboxylase/phosphopantothenate--cysteine ligase